MAPKFARSYERLSARLSRFLVTITLRLDQGRFRNFCFPTLYPSHVRLTTLEILRGPLSVPTLLFLYCF